MDGISVTCPNCSAVLNIEKQLDFCFCTYCGTKVFIPKMGVNDNNINITVNTGEVKTADNHVLRAKQFEEQGEYETAELYYNRALDIDASNIDALEGLKRVQSVIQYDNVIVNRKRVSVGEGKVWIMIDGERKEKIAAGNSVSFALPVGEHTFSLYYSPLSKSEKYNLIIKNNKTLYQIDFCPKMFGYDVSVTESKR